VLDADEPNICSFERRIGIRVQYRALALVAGLRQQSSIIKSL
jgi:hypothetical protein